MSTNEHTKWRDFLRPLVEAAVTALAVYAAGAQHVSSSAFDSRLTAIDVRMDAGDKRMDTSDRRSDKFDAVSIASEQPNTLYRSKYLIVRVEIGMRETMEEIKSRIV